MGNFGCLEVWTSKILIIAFIEGEGKRLNFQNSGILEFWKFQLYVLASRFSLSERNNTKYGICAEKIGESGRRGKRP
jgi:hypothetical protein